jgi:hypothetical protein
MPVMVSVRGQRKSKRSGSKESRGASTALPAESALDTGVSRYIAINGLIPTRDRRMLQFLSRHTRVPQSEYLREAIRDLLRKYQNAFDGSPFEDDEPL